MKCVALTLKKEHDMQKEGQVMEFFMEGMLCIASRRLPLSSIKKIDAYASVWKQDSAAPEKPTEPDKETWWQHWWNRIKKWLS